MRPRPACALALALSTAACTPPAAPQTPRERDDDVRSDQDPIPAADLERLDAAIAARAPLYWRLRTPDGPRCEPWHLEPDQDDPHRGRLLHVTTPPPVPRDSSTPAKPVPADTPTEPVPEASSAPGLALTAPVPEASSTPGLTLTTPVPRDTPPVPVPRAILASSPVPADTPTEPVPADTPSPRPAPPTSTDPLPEGASRYSYTYQLAEGHLRLTAPTRERDTPIDPAPPTPDTRVATGTMTHALALPCVFTGLSLAPADPTAARQVVLASNERWFLDAAACESAGPDVDPQPSAPGELHPLGCASALADPRTRARDPAPAGPAVARLRAAKRLFLLRARAGHPACELWQHTPADGDALEGSLTRDDRDEHGPRTLRYDYALLGDSLTLLGPHEFRRVRAPAGPAELTRTGGCLFTRPLALRNDLLRIGDDPWFLTRRACEQARRAGAEPRRDLDCRPGHVP